VNSDEILKAELAKALAECERLREENARLRLCIGKDLEGGHQDVERPSLNGDVRAHPSTGRYIGEGFDDARLDTLFLAMPISWRGTLQQYVGRLHRLHADKRIVRVYDYVDVSVPVLNRMYEKRVKAYEAVGYSVARPSDEPKAQPDLRFATIKRIAVQAVVAFEEARG